MSVMSSIYAHAAKKATNVSLAEGLLAEAKALRINVSQAAEAGVARAVAEKRAELWLQENRQAIESSNAYVDKHGLPLETCRPKPPDAL
jgi:antitoxin CcdA